MFTPAAVIVMSVTRSPLAPMLMAESESDDPPSVVVDSIVVVSSSPEPDGVVVSFVFTVVFPLSSSSSLLSSEGEGVGGATVGIAPLIQVAQHVACAEPSGYVLVFWQPAGSLQHSVKLSTASMGLGLVESQSKLSSALHISVQLSAVGEPWPVAGLPFDCASLQASSGVFVLPLQAETTPFSKSAGGVWVAAHLTKFVTLCLSGSTSPLSLEQEC